jgi:acetyl-CoA acetyltransferase
MHDAVIVEAVRTPVGKRNGALSGVIAQVSIRRWWMT